MWLPAESTDRESSPLGQCAPTLGRALLGTCLALALAAAPVWGDSESQASQLADERDQFAAAGSFAQAREKPSLLTIPAQMDDYRDAIAQLETEHGAWGHGLAEQLSGLGESFQQRGLHRQAIEIFDRAVHISRINNGLYDLGQVPIIESMLDSLKARGRWEEVHERHQYLFWLHKRNFGANDPRMLPVIDRLGKWYINDFALNPQRRMMDQLVDAHNLFQHAIGIITGNFGEDDLRLIEPLKGLVMSNWYFANYQGSGLASPLERERLTRELGVDQVAFAESDASNRLTQYLRNNYAGGKKAIEKMVQIYSKSPDAPPGAAARAKVELADWEQLFERRTTAAGLYREAYHELAAHPVVSKRTQNLFARPVALPDLGFVESDLTQASEADAAEAGTEPMHYVLVSFDVNRFGNAENIEIIEAQPAENQEQQARIKETLQSTRFRPRLVNGLPVDTKGLTQRYVFSRD